MAKRKKEVVKQKRKSGLTKNKRKRIIQLVREGFTRKQVAEKVGISKSALYKWFKADEAFKAEVDQAAVESADTLVEQALEIADDESKDFYEDSNGDLKPNAVAVQRAKLKMGVRTKLAAYRNPGVYSDRQNVEFSGSIGGGYVGLNQRTYLGMKDGLHIFKDGATGGMLVMTEEQYQADKLNSGSGDGHFGGMRITHPPSEEEKAALDSFSIDAEWSENNGDE